MNMKRSVKIIRAQMAISFLGAADHGSRAADALYPTRSPPQGSRARDVFIAG